MVILNSRNLYNRMISEFLSIKRDRPLRKIGSISLVPAKVDPPVNETTLPTNNGSPGRNTDNGDAVDNAVVVDCFVSD
jgi:hypothetical protein